ncbi:MULTISPECIES: hypothetical protein [unclassified Bradyrhizobium]|uniref:hypothetical protein n=1 Tax=unclassified Bradyrhizobium TaxID=2631580 RepID=UPI001FF9FAE8|nr:MULTISPECIES: hypothetical protein [unclassified Bradyrhizobium]MCK1550280.1 hypothetical protein [Bradyrhizobium sp. 177]MCK1601335.1 hypothetical protein [Bradyrhizobium sp. 166]MCK1690096.1 hypothetical protein [Bradyrhizobium sp. 145]
MPLTPFLVARSQLLTAIDLFFEDRDPVSIQALAGNARELLESLCRLRGIEPMTELLLRDHPGRPKRDIYAALNLYRNCFKHVGDTEAARKDDQLTLDQFDDTKNEYLLYVCVEDYLRLREKSPVAMQILQAWFCALHVELLSQQELGEIFLKAFPGIGEMSRSQQKRGGLGVLRKFENDTTLLSHPDTEPAILPDDDCG